MCGGHSGGHSGLRDRGLVISLSGIRKLCLAPVFVPVCHPLSSRLATSMINALFGATDALQVLALLLLSSKSSLG